MLRHHPFAEGVPGISRISSLALILSLLFPACSEDATRPGDSSACSTDPGVICTWAGTGAAAYDGDGNSLLESSFYLPADLMFTSDGTPYILDWNNHRVRRLTASGVLETAIGTDFVGDGPFDQSDLVPPGAPGTECNLNHPTQMIELADGRLLLTAWHNHKLRRYDPATGYELVIAGGDAGFSGDGGPMAEAQFSQPAATVQASDGSLYVLDQRNQRIRRISPDGIVSTVVGTGEKGYGGDGGPPAQALLNLPDGPNPPNYPGLAIDDRDRLYFADLNNHRIRRVDFAADIIETVAGTGVPGFSGDGGPAVAAQINTPRDVEIGPDGNLYFSDELNHRVRRVDLATGRIETVAGTGESGYDGDGGPAVEARLNRPHGLAFDPAGRLYIVDTYNHVIRRVTVEE